MIQRTIIYSIQSINNEQNNSNLSDNNTLNLIINSDESKQMYLIHKTIKQYLLNQRQGNAHTKTRSEVKGGGRKPWKQKGTGRARAGSIRSPLWKGGGVIFGPKNKIYKNKINKKEKHLAIKTLIYNKFQNTIIIDNFLINSDKPKTKTAINIFKNLGISITNNYDYKILLIIENDDKNLYLSIRNLPNVELITAYNLNALSLIKANKIVITIEALNAIKKIYEK